jgi:hypothetical protein
MIFSVRAADSVGLLGDGRSKVCVFQCIPSQATETSRSAVHMHSLLLMRAMLVCFFKDKSPKHKDALFRIETVARWFRFCKKKGCSTCERRKAQTFQELAGWKVGPTVVFGYVPQQRLM